MKRLRIKRVQKQKLKNRIFLATCVLLSTSAVFMIWFVYFETPSTATQASSHDQEESEFNNVELPNSELITEFTWEYDSPIKATLGADATSIDPKAHTISGGRAGTKGLSAGLKSKGINLCMGASESFNANGIDISLDFRCISAGDGSFFSRGKGFDFGIQNGFLNIIFSLKINDKIERIVEATTYEVPKDGIFRTYRFIFSPTTSKAEMFVNNVAVWNHQCSENSPLHWTNDPVIIGKSLTASRDEAIIDNLVIRISNDKTQLYSSLYNFSIENFGEYVRIKWKMTSPENSESFTVERSVNGSDFVKLANVKTDAATDEYLYEDKRMPSPVLFYRLRQSFKDGGFLIHPPAAIKIKSAKS